MKKENRYTNYTDFLKDKQFLQWQWMPDEQLNSYWDEFFMQHPALIKESEKAIIYLRKGINKSTLNGTEQTALLERIQKTIRQEQIVKRRRLLWYASASVAAVALIVIGISLFFSTSRQRTAFSEQELIVGELLNNEDIQLITSGEAVSFQNDIEVTLSKEGMAEIVQGDETRKIQIGQDKLNSLVVPYGKRSTLTLPDGSRIWLNSGSVLEFPAQFSGKKREIRLASGEMYIEVAHDKGKPFYVQTNNFDIKVYGTKFNISNYSDSPQSVVLVEGSVSVQSKGNKELFIKPNEQVVYSESSGTFETQSVDVNQFISWKEGYLAFDKTPMTEVLQQIRRYYNLSFGFENDVNLQKRTCTGKIYLSDNLDNVMATITLLTSTKYKKEKNSIYITNKPK